MNGQQKKAMHVLEAALELDHGDTAALFLMGTLYEEEGKIEKALRIFKKLSYLKPVKNEVYTTTWEYVTEEINNWPLLTITLASIFFFIFKNSGRFQKAAFHFNKAKELASGNADLLEKIRKETDGVEKTKGSNIIRRFDMSFEKGTATKEFENAH